MLRISPSDPLFDEIKDLDFRFRKSGDLFYLSAQNIRTYSKTELEAAKILQFYAKSVFEPCGEDCGTVYDESIACEFCGAYAKQVGPLRLKRSSIPKKDIACSIGDEMIFSQRFVDAFEKNNLKGAIFEQVLSGKNQSGFCQIVPNIKPLNVSSETIVKADVFNDFPKYEDYTWVDNFNKQRAGRVYYHCPKGHLLGGNLISEVFVENDENLAGNDLLLTKQLLGIRRGVFRPYPIHLCSQQFRQMVLKESLSGFVFQVAHIV